MKFAFRTKFIIDMPSKQHLQPGKSLTSSLTAELNDCLKFFVYDNNYGRGCFDVNGLAQNGIKIGNVQYNGNNSRLGEGEPWEPNGVVLFVDGNAETVASAMSDAEKKEYHTNKCLRTYNDANAYDKGNFYPLNVDDYFVDDAWFYTNHPIQVPNASNRAAFGGHIPSRILDSQVLAFSERLIYEDGYQYHVHAIIIFDIDIGGADPIYDALNDAGETGDPVTPAGKYLGFKILPNSALHTADEFDNCTDDDITRRTCQVSFYRLHNVYANPDGGFNISDDVVMPNLS